MDTELLAVTISTPARQLDSHHNAMLNDKSSQRRGASAEELVAVIGRHSKGESYRKIVQEVRLAQNATYHILL